MAARQSAGTRAKDSDRNDTCQILDSALADGQLSMEEHRTRVALATGAETLGDLKSLVSARDALHEAGRREEHLPEHRSQP